MGIRFLCPNGHKLNVKAFLAGKRGFCPYCEVKFVIPQESQTEPVPALQSSALEGTEQPNAATPVLPNTPSGIQDSSPAWKMPTVAEQIASGARHPHSGLAGAEAAAPAAQANPAITHPTAAAARPAGVVHSAVPGFPSNAANPKTEGASPDPFSDAPTASWYVRLPTGAQYGPAGPDHLRQWLAENRVPGNALVWREGWPDWRRADQTFQQLSGGTTQPVGHPAPTQSAAPVQAQPVQAQPVQAQPVQAQPVQAQPVMAQPVMVATAPVATPMSPSSSQAEEVGEDTAEFLTGLATGQRRIEPDGEEPRPGRRRRSQFGLWLVVLMLVLVLVGLIITLVIAVPETSAYKPTSLTIQQGDVQLEVVMPFPPVKSQQGPSAASPGGLLRYEQYRADGRQTVGYLFQVNFAAIPNPDAAERNQTDFLRRAAEFASRGLDGAEVDEGEKIAVGGLKGRDYYIPGNTGHMRVRVITTGQSVCVLSVQTSLNQQLRTEQVREFFDSLRRGSRA